MHFNLGCGETLHHIGSGTFVTFEGSHFILTAAHVWRVLKSFQETATTVKEVMEHSFRIPSNAISDFSIVVYERGYDDIIITERVISRPVRETSRTNMKDLLLTAVPLLLLVPVTALIVVTPEAGTPEAYQHVGHSFYAWFIGTAVHSFTYDSSGQWPRSSDNLLRHQEKPFDRVGRVDRFQFRGRSAMIRVLRDGQPNKTLQPLSR